MAFRRQKSIKNIWGHVVELSLLSQLHLSVNYNVQFGLSLSLPAQVNRVGLVVWQLGWVDLDLECSTILLGQ